MKAILIDFGLAREFVQDEIQTHTNSRTESFAPIEQYEKTAKRGAYTDVYALAATFYYILTLQLPFPAPFRRQGATLIPPQQHNPNISDRINLAILKGMELNSENRSPSITAWLELLKGTAIPNRSRVVNPQSSAFNPPLPALNRISSHPARHTSPRTFPQNPAPPINTSAPTAHPIQSISLISIAGVDYAPLQELLSQGKFKDADQETARMLLKLADREKAGWLDKIHVDNLPCEDLRTIDQLWQQGSNGRFGCSVQQRIYKAVGGTSAHNVDTWKLYCDRIGWRQNNKMLSYKDLNFSLWATEGHLPMLGLQIWGFTGWFAVLISRLEMCHI
jgi:serine/threonine protein kinase